MAYHNPPAHIDETHSGGAGAHGTNHIDSPKTYWLVYIGLLAGLIFTVIAAVIHIPGPGVGIAIALFIAIAKAGAVVWYFMGVRHGTRLVWLWAAAGFVWLLVMFGFIMSDYVARWNDFDVQPVGWEKPTD